MTEIERVHQRVAYANPFVTVYDDVVRFPSGREGTYVRVVPREPGLGVVIVPLRENDVGLVRTFRYPVGAHQWAFPRGFGHDVDPLKTAAAELLEELGAEARSLELIGHVTPDAGLLASRVAVIRAEVTSVSAHTDDEVDQTVWIPRHTLRAKVAAGEIEDGFTLAALALLGSDFA